MSSTDISQDVEDLLARPAEAQPAIQAQASNKQEDTPKSRDEPDERAEPSAASMDLSVAAARALATRATPSSS